MYRFLILFLTCGILFLSCKKKKEDPDCSDTPLTAAFTMSATDRYSDEAGDWKGVLLYAYQLGWQDQSLENDTLFSPYIYLNASDQADEYEWTVTQNYLGEIYVDKFAGKSYTPAKFLSGEAVVALKVKKYNTKCKNVAPLEASSFKKFYVNKFNRNGYPGDSTICTVGYSFNGKYKGVFEDKPKDTIVVNFSNCNPILFNDLGIDIPTRYRYVRVSGLTDSCIISPRLGRNQTFATNQIYMEDWLYKKCYFVRTYLSFVNNDKNQFRAVVSYSPYADAFIPNPTSVIRTFNGKRQ